MKDEKMEGEEKAPDQDGRVAVIVAAGGAGRRMEGTGGGVRKQYLELRGEPLILHSLRPFLTHPEVGAIVIALPPEDLEEPPAWLTELDPRIELVAGGEERGDSVRNALARVPEKAKIVLVHDAARPLVDRATIDRTIEAAGRGVGAIAAIPLTDTLKEVDDEGRITSTPDRSRYWRAQTPQAFPRDLLIDATESALAAGFEGTDDAAIVEHYGGRVVVVEGSPENIKVTTPVDLVLADAILRERPQPTRGEKTTAPRPHAEATVIPFRTARDRARNAPRVAAHLRAGGLIAYPTETVYGIGCALDSDALERLATLKGRTDDEPFLLLVEDTSMVSGVVWSEMARRLAATFWPGPLTIVVEAKPDHFPKWVLGEGGAIALRSSPHPAVQTILNELGAPITSTSANRAGEIPATSANGVLERWAELGAPADLWILDGGPLPPSAPSTIVDCTSSRPALLREGVIPLTALAGTVGYID